MLRREFLVFLGLLATFFLFTSAPTAASAGSGPDDSLADPASLFSTSSASETPRLASYHPRELIVLLAADFTAGQGADRRPEFVESLVADLNADRSVPEGLRAGNPEGGRLGVRQRARGRLATWIEHNPDTPDGRLQRTIVLEYPEGANLEAIRTALSRSPLVENVSFNWAFNLHAAVPGDEFLGSETSPPAQSQWGVYALNLPAAWNLTRGHAYLGVIDEGLETQHEDLVPFLQSGSNTIFTGGAFRAHLSRDVLNDSTCSVDEQDPGDTYYDSTPGHGSHVAGILAATTDNVLGVAGTCWNCSLLVTKASPASIPPSNSVDEQMFLNEAAQALRFLASQGTQSTNMSFGIQGTVLEADCTNDEEEYFNFSFLCDAILTAASREISMAASSGKFGQGFLEFPARDPHVIGVGAIKPDGTLLETSNFGDTLDLVAPGASILSTVYTGEDHIDGTPSPCGDSNFTLDGQGYGLCSGTSMAAPFVTGLAGLIRSSNPLLSPEATREALVATASIPGMKDLYLGHGLPDAEAAVQRSLGWVDGQPLTNRLTPLFSFKDTTSSNLKARMRLHTTVPQAASALLLENGFDTAGSLVTSVGAFPGFCTDNTAPDCCPLNEPCCLNQGPTCKAKILVDTATRPRADLFVFTTENSPFASSPPLVPIYRLRYESGYPEWCSSPYFDFVSQIRDSAYAISTQEVEALVSGVNLGGSTYRYQLDGIEGYIFEHCNSGCPRGVVPVHRLYKATTHDTVLVPASAVASMQAAGYGPHPHLPQVVGYAYPNSDSDEDGLVDGFEYLIRTGATNPDSDGDGISDGDEILIYDASNSNPSLRGYGDPCSNGCPIFEDGFESGNTSAWSSTI